MSFLTKKIPAYILEKGNIIKMVVFTALYAIAFINIYQPFGSSTWVIDSPPLTFLFYSSIIVLVGFVVIALSRVVMYFWNQRQAIVYIQYFVWIMVEILFMSVFFTIIVLAISPKTNALVAFSDAINNTSLILLFPYILCFMYFSWVDKNRELEARDGLSPVESSARMIDFYDERQVLRLSVIKSNVLYLEAADNYVCIYYKKRNGISRYMLRNTLKALEGYLADIDIVRCHRSYMVNLEYVSVIRRQREGIFLELSIPEVQEIPLSPRYSEKVDKWLKSSAKSH